MARVLVVYGTGEGHTTEVIETLVDPLLAAGHTVDVRLVAEAPPSPQGYDTVVVGSSVHLGKHDRHVVEWATAHAADLGSRPNAFFEVCLSAAGDAEAQAEASSYVDHFAEATGWHPDLVGIFGGALLYTRYGFVKKHLLHSIAEKGGFGTDLHRDYDYTDYRAVRRFGEDIARVAGAG